MNWLWYVLIGLAAGIVSGLGIGGGAILIPALGIIMGMGQREAQHVNLLFFLPTALFALRTHIKNGNVERKGMLWITLLGVAGAVGGALVAIKIDATWLRKGFAFFMLAMAAYELVKGYKKWKEGKKPTTASQTPQ